MTSNENIDPVWRERLAAGGLTSLRDLLANDACALAGQVETLGKPGLGGRERFRWRLGNGDDDTVLFVKRYRNTPVAQQLDRIRRQNAAHSRAWWEYRQSQALTRARIGVARAVGFAEEMTGALERRSIVLLERVPGDAFDRAWTRARDEKSPCTHGRARHDVTMRLARFVAAFHATGNCHRDLYLCHVFVELDPAATRPPTFSLIDLARTHRPRWRRTRWLVKDLAQLDCSARQIGATRTDRLRFLRAYLSNRPDRTRLRVLSKRVARKSDRILERIERKSRCE